MNNGRGDILIAVAHPSEEEAVRRAAQAASCRCEVIVTGVGGAAMSWALQKRFASGSIPSVVIGAGIAGSYVGSISPGMVVTTLSDCFADMGVDDNGHFIPLFGAGLADADAPPFTGGRIHCTGRIFGIVSGLIPAVRGATVNMASGSQAAIDRIRKAWNPEIETMEGAWLAYTCAMSGVEWISVRAVSNMVEPRNLKNWNIPLALNNLEQKMIQLLGLIAGSD
jgi:futalosine hydrolase